MSETVRGGVSPPSPPETRGRGAAAARLAARQRASPALGSTSRSNPAEIRARLARHGRGEHRGGPGWRRTRARRGRPAAAARPAGPGRTPGPDAARAGRGPRAGGPGGVRAAEIEARSEEGAFRRPRAPRPSVRPPVRGSLPTAAGRRPPRPAPRPAASPGPGSARRSRGRPSGGAGATPPGGRPRPVAALPAARPAAPPAYLVVVVRVALLQEGGRRVLLLELRADGRPPAGRLLRRRGRRRLRLR